MLLDPSLNRAPDNIKDIHLMGICGTGVGALAGMLKQAGYRISGSDQQVYPPMSNFLRNQDITIMEGYSGENLRKRPDLVIVGNVITKKNPEAIALAELKIPYLSMPQALGHFFLKNKISLVVSGTHGKTTTSSLLATMLYRAGKSPGFMIGGIVQAFSSNFRIDSGKYFVVEGDEYDTAFFDKGPKFLHYQAKIAIITSIEFDHADIYSDLEAIKTSFFRLVEGMPKDGCIIANLDDPVVREVVGKASCPVLGYGFSKERFWQISKIEVTPDGTLFSVERDRQFYGNFKNLMPGRHNALNCLAVIAVLDQVGLTSLETNDHLQTFEGVKRRQEVIGEVQGITVIDDFAHHPTAVRETLAALRASYPGRNLIAVFEPRTNSSRRKTFQDDYVAVFNKADTVIIKEPVPLKNIPETDRFSAKKLVEDLQKKQISAQHFTKTAEIISHLLEKSTTGDVIAIMSNGGFDNIHQELLNGLKSTRQ